MKKIAIAIGTLVLLGAGCEGEGTWSMKWPGGERSGKIIVTEDTPVSAATYKHKDLIRLFEPYPTNPIKSPFVIRGEARGYWYFEASFPVEVLDKDGNKIGGGIAQADAEWMTEEYVPFTAPLTFTNQPDGTKGFIVFHKDNPSGLPEHDDSMKIPVTFGN